MNIESLNTQITTGQIDRFGSVPDQPEVVRSYTNHEHLTQVKRFYEYHGAATQSEIAMQLARTMKHCRTVTPA